MNVVMIKIGILIADSMTSITQFASKGEDRSYFERYKRVFDLYVEDFHPFSGDVQLKEYDCQQLQFPQDLYECDAYLITGSRHSVHDDLPWIEQLSKLIQVLYTKKIPIIGICFGNQLIAKTFGGKVEKRATGFLAEVQNNQIMTPQPWMMPTRNNIPICAVHEEEVTELPNTATLLGSHANCKNSIYKIYDKVLCFQGHPEYTIEFAKSYCLANPEFSNQADGITGKAEGQIALQWIINFVSMQ